MIAVGGSHAFRGGHVTRKGQFYNKCRVWNLNKKTSTKPSDEESIPTHTFLEQLKNTCSKGRGGAWYTITCKLQRHSNRRYHKINFTYWYICSHAANSIVLHRPPSFKRSSRYMVGVHVSKPIGQIAYQENLRYMLADINSFYNEECDCRKHEG